MVVTVDQPQADDDRMAAARCSRHFGGGQIGAQIAEAKTRVGHDESGEQ